MAGSSLMSSLIDGMGCLVEENGFLKKEAPAAKYD